MDTWHRGNVAVLLLRGHFVEMRSTKEAYGAWGHVSAS